MNSPCCMPSGTFPLGRWWVQLFPFHRCEALDRRRQVACPRCHIRAGEALGFEPRAVRIPELLPRPLTASGLEGWKSTIRMWGTLASTEPPTSASLDGRESRSQPVFSSLPNESLCQGGGADQSPLTLSKCPIARTPRRVLREMSPSGSDSFIFN